MAENDTPAEAQPEAPKNEAPKRRGPSVVDDAPATKRDVDVKLRDEKGNVTDAPEEHIVTVAPGNTHADEPYIGTDPVYQNHANDTEAPLVVDADVDDSDLAEGVLREALTEARAAFRAEEQIEEGNNLGRLGFTTPTPKQPPRTLDEIRAHEEDKARRMEEARRRSEEADNRAKEARARVASGETPVVGDAARGTGTTRVTPANATS